MIDLFLPRVCIHCKGRCEAEATNSLTKYLCNICLRIFDASEPPELSHFKSNIAKTSAYQDASLFVASSFLEGTVIQSMIHAFKYSDMPRLAQTVGQSLGKRYQSEVRSYDLLLPIPLHSTRLSSRGYNQAEELARGLGKEWSLPVHTLLKRTRATQTQTKLSLENRILNTQHVFSLTSSAQNVLSGKRVLLVDDVITTGSTIGNALKILLMARPHSVGIMTLAATP